jgi:hypothetical protein
VSCLWLWSVQNLRLKNLKPMPSLTSLGSHEWRYPKDEHGKVMTDPHSPAHYRVIGPMRDMPEFKKAWGCSEGDLHGAGRADCDLVKKNGQALTHSGFIICYPCDLSYKIT